MLAAAKPPASRSGVNTARMSAEQLQAVVKQIREQNGKPVAMAKPVTPKKATTAPRKERIQLSLCDGMGAAMQMTKAIDADITHYIGVEKNPEKRRRSR